jgi:membrane associated rhomboid family serine protease
VKGYDPKAAQNILPCIKTIRWFAKECMRVPFKLRQDRTIVVTPINDVPAGATPFIVDLQPAEPADHLLYWIVASICVVFLFTRLDAVTASQTVRGWIIALIDWGTLYTPYFPQRVWSPVTCMWFHGSFEHLFGNLFAMILCALWLSRAYGKKWWMLFFFVGGPIAGVADAFIHHAPAADFAHWHGKTLDSIFWQPNTPLAGASGGVFAMWGAALTAGVRYRMARKTGVRNVMRIGITDLLACALAQFIFIDLGNSGIAGLAHQVSFVLGFLLGFLPPIKGKVSILMSRPDIVAVDSINVSDRMKYVTSAGLFLTPEFDLAKDSLVLRQESIGYGGKPHLQLLKGVQPTTDSKLVKLPLDVVEVKLPAETYRRTVRRLLKIYVPMLFANALIAQMLFGKEVSASYPSLFVAVLAIGIVIVIPNISSQATLLQWKDKPELPSSHDTY